MSELKNCPFCGEDSPVIMRMPERWIIGCVKCGAEVSVDTSHLKTTCQMHKAKLNVCDKWNTRTESTQLDQVTKERDEFASIARALLKAAKQYIDYEHDGDPWSEDARQMGEMEINDLYNEGKLDEFKAKLNQ